MKKTVLIILLVVLLLTACDNTEKQKISDPVSGKRTEVEFRSLTIVCDLEKGIGLAYVTMGKGDWTNSAGGMLSPEDFNRFCGTAAELSGKKVN